MNERYFVQIKEVKRSCSWVVGDYTLIQTHLSFVHGLLLHEARITAPSGHAQISHDTETDREERT